ncbi:MAG: regulatory protein GemA, partial [Azoarcus sp.]|jgi:hypothetical protein|nr:regulatory protein GemA [Azoarcus sp.]
MSTFTVHQRQLLGIAKTWALKNLPGWSDECHRDLIARHGAVWARGTDRVSALTMSAGQLSAALDDYARRGWPRHRSHKKPDGTLAPVPPRVAHLVRLWGKLGQAGLIRDVTRSALLAWCARQTQHEVPNLDALTAGECQRVTEAMKSWLGRAA